MTLPADLLRTGAVWLDERTGAVVLFRLVVALLSRVAREVLFSVRRPVVLLDARPRASALFSRYLTLGRDTGR